MVQRYVVHNTEMNRISDGDLRDNKEWSLVVKYEDYEKLAKSVRACVAAIREGSLTVEHVQGYLEGVVEVLDGH